MHASYPEDVVVFHGSGVLRCRTECEEESLVWIEAINTCVRTALPQGYQYYELFSCGERLLFHVWFIELFIFMNFNFFVPPLLRAPVSEVNFKNSSKFLNVSGRLSKYYVLTIAQFIEITAKRHPTSKIVIENEVYFLDIECIGIKHVLCTLIWFQSLSNDCFPSSIWSFKKIFGFSPLSLALHWYEHINLHFFLLNATSKITHRYTTLHTVTFPNIDDWNNYLHQPITTFCNFCLLHLLCIRSSTNHYNFLLHIITSYLLQLSVICYLLIQPWQQLGQNCITRGHFHHFRDDYRSTSNAATKITMLVAITSTTINNDNYCCCCCWRWWSRCSAARWRLCRHWVSAKMHNLPIFTAARAHTHTHTTAVGRGGGSGGRGR